ncbi:hypothetical protein ACFX2I_006238 [Malus domestica]
MSKWDIEDCAKKLGYTKRWFGSEPLILTAIFFKAQQYQTSPKIAKYYYTLPNDRTYKPMVADSDFWTLATVLPLNRVVLVYIVDDDQLINSAPNIEIQASANPFDIPHMSAPNIEIQASTNSFDIPHMYDPLGIFEGFLEQAYEGDWEQDNLVEVGMHNMENEEKDGNGNSEDSDYRDSDYEQSDVDDNLFDDNVEKTKGKYTNGKCNGNRSGSSSSSEGEQPMKRKSKNKMPKLIPFRSDLNIKNPQFRTGMIFSNRKEFRQAVTYYGCVNERQIRFPIRERYKVQGKRSNEGCPWVIYASKIDGSSALIVKTLNDVHTCPRKEKLRLHTSTWLSHRYAEDLLDNLKWDVSKFQQTVHKQYNLHVTLAQLYKARSLAAEKNEGAYVEQYARLWDCCEKLKRRNPGSTILVKTKME